MELAVIVVIYNRSLRESETAASLLRFAPENTTVLIYDNSETDFGNAELCNANHWRYLGGQGNMGLSKAYNHCIDTLQRAGFQGLICIFDDDTELAQDYFSAVLETAECHPTHSVFFPLLYSGDRILSPQIIHPDQRAKYFSNSEECLDYAGPNLFAFNSGMAVRAEVFHAIRYDEALFMDGVDYMFLRECYRCGLLTMPVGVSMNHGFSGSQKPGYTAAYRRFENYARDYAHVLKDNPSGYRYLVGKRALHLVLIYKRLSFLRIYRRYKREVLS